MRGGDHGTAGVDSGASMWVFNPLVSNTISGDLPYFVYGYLYITDQPVLRQPLRPMGTGPKACPNSLKNDAVAFFAACLFRFLLATSAIRHF